MNYEKVRIYLTPEQKAWLGETSRSFSLSAEVRTMVAHLMEIEKNDTNSNRTN